MGMKVLYSTYKYNKKTYTKCPIFDESCQFTPDFIKGCKEGRTMIGCSECKETNPMVLLKCNLCGNVDKSDKLDELKKLGWLIFREDNDVKCICPHCINI